MKVAIAADHGAIGECVTGLLVIRQYLQMQSHHRRGMAA